MTSIYKHLCGAPRGTPLPPPHGGLKIVGKHQKIYPIKGSMMPTSNFRKVWPLERKIQYGRQSLGLVTPTFFLWEIIQKFFFLSLSFHILATRNNNFCHAGGSQWVPGGLLGHFRAKTGFFEQCSIKFHVFQLLKIF